jgi:selenocysteine-specific elongation factor
MKQLILGTAGHIDHGKTSLVKALTGIDTDRLPEEKARGITIDLGFAHLQLEDMNVGIVDVPGHEGLIRNMLAGATGFDAVLLVVAADEGVMPQTREHIAIAKLLDVRRVVVAITKADTVDPEWLELVRADVDAFVRAELGDVPVVPVSSLTGAGLPELRQALSAQLRAAGERAEDDVFRMPIDRVFTIHGTGTVVTGTVWSGHASRQDALRLLPSNRTVRVRGVQAHGAAVDAGSAGERAAFALSGVDRADVGRGDALVDGGAWRAAHIITARIQLLPSYSLKQRQRVRIHLGTAEVLARVVLLADAWVQLRLEAPLVARARDRFVMRSYSPVTTIGGGQVVELERVRKRLSDVDRSLLTAILDDAEPGRIRAAIHLAAEQGCTAEELAITAAATSTDVPSDVVSFADRFYAADRVEAVVGELRSEVADFHAGNPLEPGIDRAVLLGRHAGELAAHALRLAEEQGHLLSKGGIVAAAGFEPGFTAAQQALRARLLDQLREAGLAPPSVLELTASHRNNEVRAVLRLMEARGEVSSINSDFYVDRQILGEALRQVRTMLGSEPLAAGDFKVALPVSRKYLIPLLEYMDRIGVTKREGDLRRVVTGGTPETV